MQLLDQLPEEVIHSIYLDYLFRDFLYKFRSIFRETVNGKPIDTYDLNYKQLIIHLLRHLEPR